MSGQPATLLRNVNVASMLGGTGLVPGGAVAVAGGRILWAGPMADLPGAHRDLPAVDGGGALVTPGLIDCHTHIVFAGDRAAEFEMRLAGASYAAIAQAGGGILSTVRATRAATDAALARAAQGRLSAMAATGTTTVEVKSGYGLTLADEVRMLRVARSLTGAEVRTSHLAAHALPPEYAGRPDAYLDEVAIPSLKAAHAAGLVDAVDAFCEGIAFSPAEVDRLFRAARALGLPVRLHADQLSDLGGAALAAHHGALSADHLEYLSDAGIAAMAAAGTVAVLLPGAFYTLRESRLPPVAALRAAGVPLAVATDCNPGSSPMTSLPLAMNMACTLFGLTPGEALQGVTVHAARALGLSDRGVIAPGLRADLCLWDAEHPAELAYRIGATGLRARMCAGVWDG